MITEDDRRILETFARQLREVLPDAAVFGFGSRVNGTPDPESDLDICVVVTQLNHAVREVIRDVAWHVGFDSGVVITTVKYERGDFHHGPVSVSPLVQAIMAEGLAA